MIKKTFIEYIAIVLALGLTLTGCSHFRNQQTEFATAPIVNGLVDSPVGDAVDDDDVNEMNSTLDYNIIDQPSSWINEKHQAWYKITPTSDFGPHKGYSSCRHYLAYARQHRRTVRMNGIACRVESGFWQHVT